VAVRAWPSAVARAADETLAHPVLYLVDAHAEPPRCSTLEDWVRAPIDVDELYARADRLVARFTELTERLTVVDDSDTLRVGDAIVILSPQEGRLMRLLIDQMGEIVRRDELMATVWPDGPPADPRALDNRVKSLRLRLGPVPLRIHTVRGRGLLLERTAET